MKIEERPAVPTPEWASGQPEKVVPPEDLSRLPVDPVTGEPIPPRAQPGYYPGYSTLGQQAFWDEATRKVVLHRVHDVPPIRFFTPEEVPLAHAIFDRILPQDDRDAAHRIPVLNYIDERLYEKRTNGYRFENMPPDDEAFRLGLKAIEEIAHHVFSKSFLELGPRQQDYVLETIHDGIPPAGDEIWEHMSVRHFWMLLVQDCAAAYYAHPYAWDEIGFGGPAYPRGYMRLEYGKPEPWEVSEHRYEWDPPPESLSGAYRPNGKQAELDHTFQTPGQSGTH